mmetsp:Transcript_2079/g.4483  ORF Transcript_2079/g.4483 Transcript_2079/m.4483 type:complete len:1032 (+) Transcript_2079:1-3096(+)
MQSNSRPSQNDDSSSASLLADKDDDAPVEKEAISLFFEKRKAAIAKDKLQEQQRRSLGDTGNFENRNSRPMQRNQNQRNNKTRNQSSGFQQRQPQRQSRQQQYVKGTNNNNNNHGRNVNIHRNNASYNNNNNNNNERRRQQGLSDVLQVMSRNRNRNQNESRQEQPSHRPQTGQYQQNNNDQNHNNRGSRSAYNDQQRNARFDIRNRNGRSGSYNKNNSKPEGTLRLAEMMRKLRKDAPSNIQQGRSEQSSSVQSSRQNNKNDRASWRQKRFSMPSSGDKGQVQRGRNGYNQSRRRSHPPPQAEEFLHGRISRTDNDDIDDLINSDKSEATTPERVITLPINKSLALTEVSSLFRVKVDDIRKKLRGMGVRGEDALDIDALELLAMDFGIETVRSTHEPVVVDSEQLLMQQRRSDTDKDVAPDDSIVDSYPPRPPIVTIMGHVDHGKTTLMDALRRRSQEQQKNGQKGNASKNKKKKSKNSKNTGGSITKDVAGTEAGGITQIISAFQVALEGQVEKITFLDTPGHAAFRAMRQSGSHAADVIVLVVAADDGISEQTLEIINFYKSIVKGSSESGISMVVAVNKIDKPGIDPVEAQMRIENQLLEHDIVSEGMSSEGSDYGQPVQVIPTSGLTGEGLDDLMEGLLLQSEIMDLRADDKANGEGIIMDARQEKGLGVVADCIVRWGKIEKGNVIISGDQVSQVRMLKDVNNKMLQSGLPSQPVRIIGFKSLPKAGDPVMVVESEEIAEEMLEKRRALDMSTNDRPDGPRSDVELHITGMRRGDTWRVKKFTNKAAIEEADGSVRIPIIIKADADGSLAAVRESLLNIGNDSKHTVVIDPIMEGIGEVTPSDILMAKESEATIFSFGSIKVDQTTMNLAESEGVSICSNNIIYSLLDEAKDVLGSYLPLIPHKHTHGRAMVKTIFSIDTEDGEETIAGLNVLDGNIYKTKASARGENNSIPIDLVPHFRVYRDGELISPDNESVTASSLRRFKEIVESVRLGEECGLGLSGFSGFQEGDEIECYSVEMRKAKL